MNACSSRKFLLTSEEQRINWYVLRGSRGDEGSWQILKHMNKINGTRKTWSVGRELMVTARPANFPPNPAFHLKSSECFQGTTWEQAHYWGRTFYPKAADGGAVGNCHPGGHRVERQFWFPDCSVSWVWAQVTYKTVCVAWSQPPGVCDPYGRRAFIKGKLGVNYNTRQAANEGKDEGLVFGRQVQVPASPLTSRVPQSQWHPLPWLLCLKL